MPKKQEEEKDEQEKGAEQEQEAAVAVVETAPIAYYYLPDENPTGLKFDGVPLRNLTPRDVERLPKWMQRQVRKSPMYTETAPGEGNKGGTK